MWLRKNLGSRAGPGTRSNFFERPPHFRPWAGSHLRADPGSDAGCLAWGYGIMVQDRVKHLNIDGGFLRHCRAA